jgi:hypothetical protein
LEWPSLFACTCGNTFYTHFTMVVTGLGFAFCIVCQLFKSRSAEFVFVLGQVGMQKVLLNGEKSVASFYSRDWVS